MKEVATVKEPVIGSTIVALAAAAAVLAPARVHGGVAVNVVPEKAVLELGVRTLPGTDSRMLARQVTGAVRAAVPHEQVEVQLLNDNPPLELPEDAGLAVMWQALPDASGGALYSVFWAAQP